MEHQCPADEPKDTGQTARRGIGVSQCWQRGNRGLSCAIAWQYPTRLSLCIGAFVAAIVRAEDEDRMSVDAPLQPWSKQRLMQWYSHDPPQHLSLYPWSFNHRWRPSRREGLHSKDHSQTILSPVCFYPQMPSISSQVILCDDNQQSSRTVSEICWPSFTVLGFLSWPTLCHSL